MCVLCLILKFPLDTVDASTVLRVLIYLASSTNIMFLIDIFLVSVDSNDSIPALIVGGQIHSSLIGGR